MGEKILYNNKLGAYVLNQNLNITEKIIFKNPKDQEKILEKLSKDQNLKKATPNQRKKIAQMITNKENLKSLKKINMGLTTDSIRDSVGMDQVIIQSAKLSDELDKQINQLSKRLREWSEYFYPRTSKKISDNIALANVIVSSKVVAPDKLGAMPSPKDKRMLTLLSKEIISLSELKKHSEDFVKSTLEKHAPNFTTICGVAIGSRLLMHAGSIEKLSNMPASTIQLLGAEQALFRHLKTKSSRPPKYGILHEHPLVLKAKAAVRGKVARVLADKISIALRVDRFKGQYIGDKLLKDITKRFFP